MILFDNIVNITRW